MRTNDRGQVLPMWAAGIITTLALMFLAMNYANSVRWQIRAQNAADSAAQALASVQSERWNMMTAALYASNVEEFRVRSLLDAMLLSIDRSGGCSMSTLLYQDLSTSPGTCMRNYIDLRMNYMRAVNRYGIDVKYLNDISYLATYTNWKTDSAAIMAQLNTATACNQSTATSATVKAGGGDCGFTYSVAPGGTAQRDGLQAVEEDAQGILIPGLSHKAIIAQPDSEYTGLWAPVKVDIVTCAKVPPIIPAVGPFKFQPYYAIGRAAATNVMVSEDWLQPGAVMNPNHLPDFFQPTESDTNVHGTTNPLSGQGPPYDHDFYTTAYGGNATTAYVNASVFDAPIYGNELGAHVGWWGAIPIAPFGGAVSIATACP